MYRDDDDALLKVDTPVWSYHLISAFGGGGLADTTLDYTLSELWSFFLATFSVYLFSTELLFVSSY